jgi:hypothetical protein
LFGTIIERLPVSLPDARNLLLELAFDNPRDRLGGGRSCSGGACSASSPLYM